MEAAVFIQTGRAPMVRALLTQHTEVVEVLEDQVEVMVDSQTLTVEVVEAYMEEAVVV